MFTIYPYNMASHSARALRNAFREEGVRSKLVRPDGNYRGSFRHKILTWGASTIPNWWGNSNPHNRINSPQLVQAAVNKLHFYRLMDGLVPDYTTDKEEAEAWGCDVIVRHILNGREGRGCEYISNGNNLPDAPLYSAYFRSVREYRVHVLTEGRYFRLIDRQEKRRPTNVEDADRRVRSHNNGWIFARENVDLPEVSDALIQQTVDRLPIEHADHNLFAIDLIHSVRNGTRVLEVNTAPGIEGTTLDKYFNALKEI